METLELKSYLDESGCDELFIELLELMERRLPRCRQKMALKSAWESKLQGVPLSSGESIHFELIHNVS